ncbi:MAG TPA: hypothetical protein VE685_18905 [Thermoanaerobaculia bacterium]|nr:hypothetical protein [Thermoanaerobaculia bacterium]
MRKLSLSRETLRHLQAQEVRRAAGGATFEIDTTCACTDGCDTDGCTGGCGSNGCGTGTCTQEFITTCRC